MDEQAFISWYEEEKPKYERLADVVKGEIENALKSRHVFVANVEKRTKNIESALKKSQKKNEDGAFRYQDPKTEIMDYSGVRIIAYLLSDIEYICSIIADLFDLDAKNYTDKAEGLGADKVGYLSIHYIVSLKKGVASKTDYDDLKALRCEIQVRTVLQHAWAQNFHDRLYKQKRAMTGEVSRIPEALARKTNLVAGSLELVDMNIDGLALEYDRWLGAPDNISYQKILDREPDKDALVLYIQSQLGVKDKIKVINSGRIAKLLKSYDVESLRQLNARVTPAFIEAIKQEVGSRITADRFVDCLLIWRDYETYFESCMEKTSKYISDGSYRVLQRLGVDIDRICEKYSIQKREAGQFV